LNEVPLQKDTALDEWGRESAFVEVWHALWGLSAVYRGTSLLRTPRLEGRSVGVFLI